MTYSTTSKDGTEIAYSKKGKGEPLILVDGAFCHRNFGANKPLPDLLFDHFTVYSYDRRGRGESKNKLPYSPEREYEDLETMINEAGGEAFVYGISSGAALALEAAKRGASIKKMLLYEAPYITDNSREPLREDYLETLKTHVAQNKKGKAVKHFMRIGVGLNGFIVFMMQLMPAWKKMKELAHTAVYDTEILGKNASGKPMNKEDWKNVTVPVLVVSGSKSEEWAQNSMKQLASVLPNAEHHSLSGQTHLVNPKILTSKIIDYFTENKKS